MAARTGQDTWQADGPNPDAPGELSRFDFVVGAWRGKASLRRDDGAWEHLDVSWNGRYILDGYAIADDYRMTTANGDLLVLGVNVRAYDPKSRVWRMKWLNALGGSWVDLGPEELGGVRVDENSITYEMHEPVADHPFTRATYTTVSKDVFTWRGERSHDRSSWEDFLLIELHRRRN